MKLILYILLIFCITTLHAQSPLQFTPEFGIANPSETLSGSTFRADQGELYGLHVDWVKPGKKLGFGLYGGIRNVNIQFNYRQLPEELQIGNQTGILNSSGGRQWSNYIGAIGPVVKLPFGKVFSLNGYSKVGLSQIDYPVYTESYVFSADEEYTLYATEDREELQENFNFTLVSGLGLQVNITPNLGITLGGSYIWVPNVSHVFTETTADLTAQDPSVLYENLANSETKTYLTDCSANTFNWTVGLKFGFGGKKSPKKPKEPIPDIPNRAYDCNQVEYLTPGYNQVVLLNKKSKVRFEVEDGNQKSVKKAQDYSIVFYRKRDDGSYEQIGKADFDKLNTKINLKDFDIGSDHGLYWKVESTSLLGSPNCPFDNQLMRLQVFPDKETAEENGACVVD